MVLGPAHREAVQAAFHGDMGTLQQLVAATPALLHAPDDDGFTLLGLACRTATGQVAMPPVAGTAEQHAIVDWLLAAGADPSAAAHNGWAPLHTAAMTGHLDLARRLLAAGASREGRLLGARDGSPLALALFYAQTPMARLLADPPIPDNLRTAAALDWPLDRFFDGVALTPSAQRGSDFYRPLLAFPVWERTNSRQELLDEALSWAARNDAIGAMEQLVALGANVNGNPYRGTPLLWATFGDRVNAATWLLDHGADPNLRHDFGGSTHGQQATVLHLAAQYERMGCLQLLLDRGADPTVVEPLYGGTPLGWAEHAGSMQASAVLRDFTGGIG